MLEDIDYKRSGTSLFTPYSYTYDRDDRITQVASQDGTSDYTYDAASQLTATDHSFQTDESYSWDNNGNRNSTGYTVGTNNRITTDGTYNFTYDDEGNVTRRTKISDSSVRDYTWDYRNRLTSVVDRVSAGGTITMQADYTYDVFDRRIKKVVDADGAGAGSSVTSRYVFEGGGPNVTLQFDGSNNLTHRYLWGEALDQLLADENSSNAINWSLADHLGTVRDVVNNSGAVQNHLKWDSFGAVTAESASSVDFLMGFAGTIRDEETGQNYAWHRYLQDGRWLSEDPIGFDAADVNLRRYVTNSPVLGIDRDGLEEAPYAPDPYYVVGYKQVGVTGIEAGVVNGSYQLLDPQPVYEVVMGMLGMMGEQPPELLPTPINPRPLRPPFRLPPVDGPGGGRPGLPSEPPGRPFPPVNPPSDDRRYWPPSPSEPPGRRFPPVNPPTDDRRYWPPSPSPWNPWGPPERLPPVNPPFMPPFRRPPIERPSDLPPLSPPSDDRRYLPPSGDPPTEGPILA